MNLDKLCFEQKQDSQEKVCTSKVVNVKVAQAGTAKKFPTAVKALPIIKKTSCFVFLPHPNNGYIPCNEQKQAS